MEDEEIKGLKGWLILVGLGVVITPFRTMFITFPLYFGLFRDGTFINLASPLSDFFYPSLAILIVIEMLINLGFVVFGFFCIYLYFSKHYFFPKAYSGLIVASVIFIFIDAWATSLLLADTPMFDEETLREFLRSLGAGLIWVPYLFKSERVKATFVEKIPNTPLDIGPKDGEASSSPD